jgi:hypothetical protein
MGMQEVVAEGAPSLGSSEWLAAFLLSPGLAGLAAVLAAVLGLVAARARIRADAIRAREERIRAGASVKHARAAQIADRDVDHWWAAYRWVIARADDDGTRDVAPVLSALQSTADTPVMAALARIAWTRGPDREQEQDDDRPG